MHRNGLSLAAGSIQGGRGAKNNFFILNFKGARDPLPSYGPGFYNSSFLIETKSSAKSKCSRLKKDWGFFYFPLVEIRLRFLLFSSSWNKTEVSFFHFPLVEIRLRFLLFSSSVEIVYNSPNPFKLLGRNSIVSSPSQIHL